MPCQHPGKILQRQYLEPRNISQNALARAIKVPPRRINEIIHQKRGITADTAVRLALYFGDSAAYWLRLQAEYEIDKIKDRIERELSSIPAKPQPQILAEASSETPAITGSDNARRESKIRKRLMR